MFGLSASARTTAGKKKDNKKDKNKKNNTKSQQKKPSTIAKAGLSGSVQRKPPAPPAKAASSKAPTSSKGQQSSGGKSGSKTTTTTTTKATNAAAMMSPSVTSAMVNTKATRPTYEKMGERKMGFDRKVQEKEKKKDERNRLRENQYYSNSSKKIQNYEKVTGNSDFAKYSEKGKKMGNRNPSTTDSEIRRDVGGSLYGVGSNKKVQNKAEMASRNENHFTQQNSIYRHLDDNERSLYNYHLGKYGEKQADGYIDAKRRQLNERAGKGLYEKTRKAATKNRGGALLSLATPAQSGGNALASLATVFQQGKNAITGNYEPVDPYSPAYGIANYTRAAKAGAADGLEGSAKWMMENMLLPGTGLASDMSLGPLGKVGKGLSALGAGGEAAHDAALRGGTPGQAITQGIFSGAMEALPGKKVSSRPGKKALNSVGKGVGTEIRNQAISNFSQPVVDNLVMGDNSHYNLYKQLLMDQGMSQKRAGQKSAQKTFVTSPLSQTLGGAALTGASKSKKLLNNHSTRAGGKKAVGRASVSQTSTKKKAKAGAKKTSDKRRKR